MRLIRIIRKVVALLDRWLPTRRPRVDGTPLSHKDVEWQQAQIRDATRPLPPDSLVGALQDRIHPSSGSLLGSKPARSLTPREDRLIEEAPTSPRAIVPPRKPRV